MSLACGGHQRQARRWVPVEDRRKHRRIQAPVYCRPAGVSLLARHRQPIDLSLGGVRVYSDDAHHPGTLVKLEFFTEASEPVTYTAEVVWVETLARGSPARFDIGLKFVDLEPEALEFLMTVLSPEGDS
jgi:hypothetical protein